MTENFPKMCIRHQTTDPGSSKINQDKVQNPTPRDNILKDMIKELGTQLSGRATLPCVQPWVQSAAYQKQRQDMIKIIKD